MIRCIKLLALTTIFLVNTSFVGVNKKQLEITENKLDVIVTEIPEMPRPKLKRLGYTDFMKEMAHLESGGIIDPYKVVNRYGYMGKYQFSKRTLIGLMKTGYLKTTRKEINNFTNSPELQERAMQALIKHNTDILKRYGLFQYIGKTIGGVKITLEGMLAASHLLGPYAVKHYILSGGSMRSVKVKGVLVTKYDGNGTSIKDYMNHFA